MELSNYQAFMECMRKWEKIGCNILCGLALWEQMQDCDRRGVPYTDIDIEAVSQEVAYRLMMSHDRLYALALYEWTEQHFAQNSDTSDAAAGENGCNFPTHNNSIAPYGVVWGLCPRQLRLPPPAGPPFEKGTLHPA